MELTDKYISKPDLFKQIDKSYHNVMDCLPVINATMLLNLLTAILQDHVEAQEVVDKPLFEKYFVYSLAWAIGGLFESEDREKLHQFFISRNAPLPNISS